MCWARPCARGPSRPRVWRAACRWAASWSMWTWAPSPMPWSIVAEAWKIWKAWRPHPMTLAHYCIIVPSLLPIACAGPAKSKGFGRPRREGGFDNHDPRAWLARQQGWQARANAAQANSFEALPLFIAGVLVAQQLQAPAAQTDAA